MQQDQKILLISNTDLRFKITLNLAEAIFLIN
jgi:hypothetical protein